MKEEYFSFWNANGNKIAFSLLKRYQFWLWGIGVTFILLLLLVILGTYYFYKKLIETILMISWNPYLIGVTVGLILLAVFEKNIRMKWGIKIWRVRFLTLFGTIIWVIIHFGLINGFFYWIVVSILSTLLKSFIRVAKR